VLKSDRGQSCKRQDESGGWLLASRQVTVTFHPVYKQVRALHAVNDQPVDDLRYLQIAAKSSRALREHNM
jgi:hypothetical protein